MSETLKSDPEFPPMPEGLRIRYQEALHGMQTGVFATMLREAGPSGTLDIGRFLKHLRVGVNSALVEHGALLTLMLRKGVFTPEEYWAELVAGMERERATYEADLGVKLG